jgi:hypothetical protein
MRLVLAHDRVVVMMRHGRQKDAVSPQDGMMLQRTRLMEG